MSCPVFFRHYSHRTGRREDCVLVARNAACASIVKLNARKTLGDLFTIWNNCDKIDNYSRKGGLTEVLDDPEIQEEMTKN